MVNKFEHLVDRIAAGVPHSYMHLADRIERFLKKYGKRSPNGEWNGPDSDMLDCSVEILRGGNKPNPWSDWSSGCYMPYNDDAGRREHDAILNEIRRLPKL